MHTLVNAKTELQFAVCIQLLESVMCSQPKLCIAMSFLESSLSVSPAFQVAYTCVCQLFSIQYLGQFSKNPLPYIFCLFRFSRR